jgi:hypothetical protein
LATKVDLLQQRPAESDAPQEEELIWIEAVDVALRENRQVKIAQLEPDKFSDRTHNEMDLGPACEPALSQRSEIREERV